MASSSSPTRRTCYCQYQESNTFHQNHTRRKMQRRGAVICTTPLRPSHHLITCRHHHETESGSEASSSSPKTTVTSHSHSPERRRRKRSGYKRRFALCGNHALDPTILKKVAELVRSERMEHSHQSHSAEESDSSELSLSSSASDLSMMPRRISRATAKPTDILFLNGRSGSGSTSKHAGNVQFQCIIHSYYVEMYQYTITATHRSIVRSAALDDLKSRGYTFYQEQAQGELGSQSSVRRSSRGRNSRIYNNHNHNNDNDNDKDDDDDKSFYAMDDMEALQKIRGAFHALTRRRRSARRGSNSSAGNERETETRG